MTTHTTTEEAFNGRSDGTLDGGPQQVSGNGAVERPRSDYAREELLLDAESSRNPKLSVVMPTLNEEEGIGECIERVKRGLEELQVYGEIIVSDDSTDRTPEIAEEMGAIVVTPDGKGYGYAYQYAFERVRGDIVAMGDADATYDFGELPKLYEVVSSDEADMAIGSRLDGEIKDGAMPKLHQYIGNPLLTRVLNAFYGADVSDAHSGLRVFTKDAYDRMDLRTTGMEFASEMIIRAGAADLRIREIPITYHERKGEATLDSFRDGWRHVRFMLVNAPGHLFSGPGISLTLAGLLTMVVALTGVEFDGTSLGVNSMIAGSLFTIVGIQVASFGAFATIAGEPIRRATDPVTEALVDRIGLEHGATAGLTVFAMGAAYSLYVVWRWMTAGFDAVPGTGMNIAAFTACVTGLQVVFTSFLLSVLADTHQ